MGKVQSLFPALVCWLAAQPSFQQADSLLSRGSYRLADSLYGKLLPTLDPASPAYPRALLSAGRAAYYAARYAAAESLLQRTLQAPPDSEHLFTAYTYQLLARHQRQPLPLTDSLLNAIQGALDCRRYPRPCLRFYELYATLLPRQQALSLLDSLLPRSRCCPEERTRLILVYLSYLPSPQAFLTSPWRDSLLPPKANPTLYASYLTLQGDRYEQVGNSSLAESLLTQAAALRATYLGTSHPDYAKSLNLLGVVYYNLGQYGKVLVLFQQAADIRKQTLGPEHPDYAASLSNLGAVYYELSQYDKALELLQQVTDIHKKALGPEHPHYVMSLSNLGNVYSKVGQYDKALEIHQQVADIRQKVFGPENPDYAASLNNIGNVYSDLGQYDKALELYQQAADIYKKALGPEHPYYASSLNNLAVIYRELGRYDKALELHQQVANIRKKAFGPQHPDYAASLNNLGSVYSKLGQYDKALELYQQAADIRKEALGPEHPYYASSLNNLGNAYFHLGQYDKALELLQQAADIHRQALGPEHPYYASSLNNLGNTYFHLGQYDKALELLQQAADLWKKALGPEHPEYAKALNNLGSVYQKIGQYGRALELCQQATTILREALGPSHPDYASSLQNLARTYAALGQMQLADSLFSQALATDWRFLHRASLYLSAHEKHQLLTNTLQEPFYAFLQHAAARAQENPALLALAYKTARSLKGYILSSTRTLQRLLAQSPDSTSQALFTRWQQTLRTYAHAAAQEDYATADSLAKLADILEKQLLAQAPALTRYLPDPFTEPTFPPLKPHETAIEILRIPLPQDSALYLFFLLHRSKKDSSLSLLTLPLSKNREKQALNAYTLLTDPTSTGTNPYPYLYLWKHLDSLLPPTTKRLYLAPDGLYYLLNPATFYNPSSKHYLADKYEFSFLTSTRRLLLPPEKPSKKPPLILADPDYGHIPSQLPPNAPTRNADLRSFPAGIPPLPGARQEAQAIASRLHTQPLLGPLATEDTLKTVQAPAILHIATHGLFAPGNPATAMTQSCLLLAGAAAADSLFLPPTLNDGRLTAQEAATLNLSGTQLVALSACNTGLGEPSPEGTFGLQRGFLLAGAQTVLASLWPVNDTATRDFMIHLYKNLTKHPAPKAFAKAQQKTRKLYPHPYYWGAFVLVR